MCLEAWYPSQSPNMLTQAYQFCTVSLGHHGMTGLTTPHLSDMCAGPECRLQVIAVVVFLMCVSLGKIRCEGIRMDVSAGWQHASCA